MQRGAQIETADDGTADQVLIVGGGIAGSLLALTLGRAGYSVVVFDPRREPQASFRCEKLNLGKIEQLRRLGVLAQFEAACWPDGAYPPDARPSLADCGSPHEAWVAQVRAAWPDNVRFVEAMVERIETSTDRQTVITAAGERVPGRLVVVASGKGSPVRETLGVADRPISLDHSVCMGFSVARDGPFQAETVQVVPGHGVAYVSLFPMPGETRVNLFSFRPLTDPWSRRMAKDPLAALAEVSPRSAALLGDGRLIRRCEARVSHLHEVHGHIQPGLILIGDAFHAPCPASGSGMTRIFNDVALLTQTYLPLWLATPGMGAEKIAAYYDDPAKRRLDALSLKKSLNGRRSTLGVSPYWRTRRRLGDYARQARASVDRAAEAAAVVLSAGLSLFG